MALNPEIEIDLEDIPLSLVREGIEWQFEFDIPDLDEYSPKRQDFINWGYSYRAFIDSCQEKYRIKLVTKGLEYGKKIIERHKPKCTAQPGQCPREYSLNSRIELAEAFLAELQPKIVEEKPLTAAELVWQLNELFGFKDKGLEFFDNLNYERLIAQKEASYEKKKQSFIKSININKPEDSDIELDLDLYRKSWVEKELQPIDSLLSDKYPNGDEKFKVFRYLQNEDIGILHKVVITKYRMYLQAEFHKVEQKLNPNPARPEQDEIKNPEFTVARQVLAMHYLFECCQIKNIDNSKKAKFIEFLTGKNNKNIYDAIRSPLKTKEGNFRKEDLQYIRPYFENLGLSAIVKMINNELDKPNT